MKSSTHWPWMIVPAGVAVLVILALVTVTATHHLSGQLLAQEAPEPGTDTEGVGPSPVEFASIVPQVTETGLITLSQDAIGTNSPPKNLQVDKPSAGATVRSAWVGAVSTGFRNHTIPNGAVEIDSGSGFNGVNWDIVTNSSISSKNHWAEVTLLVKADLDAAPVGLINVAVDEASTTLIDGVSLSVIWDDPAQTLNNTVILLFGAQAIAGDTFNIGLAEPIDPEVNICMDMSLGIGFGFQGNPQVSLVDVNGVRLTSSAGGQDDGEPRNGALITVGGIGDTNANPAPFAPPAGNHRFDDELYSLLPFVSAGDTSITVFTINPSNDDNIYYASLFLCGAVAIVGEGITLSPASDTNDVGQTHTVTAKVQDDNGNPVVGRDVTFKVTSGPHAGTLGTVATDVNGEASITYPGTAAGVDLIVATFVDSKGNTQTSNTVTKTWELLAAADSQVTDISVDFLGNDRDPATPNVLDVLKSSNIPIRVTSTEHNFGPQDADSVITFLADIPLGCEGQWIPPTFPETDTFRPFDPLFPLDQGVGLGPTPGKDLGDGNPATAESVADGIIPEPVSVPVVVPQDFELHCFQDGLFVFTFCNKQEVLPPLTDPDLTNNFLCFDVLVNSIPNADLSAVAITSDPPPPFIFNVSEINLVSVTEIKHNLGPQEAGADVWWTVQPIPEVNVRWVAQPDDICTLDGVPVPCGEGDIPGDPSPDGDTCQDLLDNDGDELIDGADSDCQTDINDIHFQIGPLPVSVLVPVVRDIKIHCKEQGTFLGAITVDQQPLPPEVDPNPTNNSLTVPVSIACLGAPEPADLVKLDLTAEPEPQFGGFVEPFDPLAEPPEVKVSEQAFFKLTQVLHNNGPAEEVLALDIKRIDCPHPGDPPPAQAESPTQCSAVFTTDMVEAEVVGGVQYSIKRDTNQDGKCDPPKLAWFNGSELGLDLGERGQSSLFPQPPDSPPNSPFLQPGDCIVADSTPGVVNELGVRKVLLLPISIDVTDTTEFDVHCTGPSLHTFTVQDEIVLLPDPLQDPDPTNNAKEIQVTVACIADADLEVQSLVGPASLTPTIFVSELRTITATIHNIGPDSTFPAGINVWLSEESPPLANLKDTDMDGVVDNVEAIFQSNPLDDSSTPEALEFPGPGPGTTCNDGANNDGVLGPDGFDPKCKDFDSDGISDAFEVVLGSNPGLSASTPEHAILPWTCNDGVDNDGDGKKDDPVSNPGPLNFEGDDDIDGFPDCSVGQLKKLPPPVPCVSGWVLQANDMQQIEVKGNGTIIVSVHIMLPPPGVSNPVLVTRDVVIDCFTTGSFEEIITAQVMPKDPHVIDPNPDNDKVTIKLPVDPEAVGVADVKIVSWTIPTPPPTTLAVSKRVDFDTVKTIANAGPDPTPPPAGVSVDVQVTKSMNVPVGADGSVHSEGIGERFVIAKGVTFTIDTDGDLFGDTPPDTGPKVVGPLDESQNVIVTGKPGLVEPEITVLFDVQNLVVDEPQSLTETFDIHCSEPGTHTFTLINKVSNKDPTFADPDFNNNNAFLEVTVNCEQPLFLIIDEESIDNGTSTIEAISDGPPFCGGPAGGPATEDNSGVCVNDDIASNGAGRSPACDPNNPMVLFSRPGPPPAISGLVLPTGQFGDEGLFSLISPSAAFLNDYLDGCIPQSALDPVAGFPLRNLQIEDLEGRTVCAVVHDSNVSHLEGNQLNLQGNRLGLTAFDVTAVLPPGGLPESGSSSSLPDIQVDIINDPDQVLAICQEPFEFLPEPPPDVDNDGDGFDDNVEVAAGTNPVRACGIDANPADVNNDGFTDGSDIGALAARFGQTGPPRLDVAPGSPAGPDGFVDGSDIGALAARFGQSCTP